MSDTPDTDAGKARELATLAAQYFDHDGDDEFIENFTKDALVKISQARRDGWDARASEVEKANRAGWNTAFNVAGHVLRIDKGRSVDWYIEQFESLKLEDTNP